MMYPIIHGIVAQGGLEPPGPAWALWLMQEGSGQTLSDSSGNGRDLRLGVSDDVEASDPAWTTLNGAVCLEFAGGQICTPRFSVNLPQPYTLLAIGRWSTANRYMMIINTRPGGNFGANIYPPSFIGLRTSAWLVGPCPPQHTWFGYYGVAFGTSSIVGTVGSTPITGEAGSLSMTLCHLGARDNMEQMFGGHIAAAAVLDKAATVDECISWCQYLAAVKGITL